ncbi:hypothetical protein CYMTET_49319 [Cymbomonas tetramitiformis]|uniref:Uncharacterized protein n=1 Tax=Cymbomonas tetramitiformis TaxID=36881 RepID=A0AAE0EU95_9CHLO|nr:hypothetical protein CYMTET_49319 [Cymbomonas tetramitiformis]
MRRDMPALTELMANHMRRDIRQLKVAQGNDGKHHTSGKRRRAGYGPGVRSVNNGLTRQLVSSLESFDNVAFGSVCALEGKPLVPHDDIAAYSFCGGFAAGSIAAYLNGEKSDVEDCAAQMVGAQATYGAGGVLAERPGTGYPAGAFHTTGGVHAEHPGEGFPAGAHATNAGGVQEDEPEEDEPVADNPCPHDEYLRAGGHSDVDPDNPFGRSAGEESARMSTRRTPTTTTSPTFWENQKTRLLNVF